MTLVRQNAVTGDIAETTETTQGTEPMASSWPSAEAMLDDVLKLADKLEACEKTKNERRQQFRRVAEHVGDDLDEITTLTVLSAESVNDYCESCAPQSVDTYCKMALAFHRLAASAQGHTDLPVPVCREMAALESMMADFEHERRNKQKPPPPLMSFLKPAHAMFEKLSTKHTDDIAYVDLALAVWFMFTVFGIATRTRTLLTARWGDNFRREENGDWHIQLGDPNGGTKHKFPLSVKLSELSNLCNAGLLYPDLATTALDWLYSRTKGDKDGRLVFSRSETKDSPFGKAVFGTYMREQYKSAKDMDCGALRKRIEIMANQLLKAEKITAADRALASTLLQHKAETAALDYLPAGDTELAESEPEPTPELEQISEPEPTESTETSPPQSIVVHNGDVLEIAHEYEGLSTMCVTLKGEHLLLILVPKPHNSKYDWTFAPHRAGFKSNIAEMSEYGTFDLCISPSPDLSSPDPMQLLVGVHEGGFATLLPRDADAYQLRKVGNIGPTPEGSPLGSPEARVAAVEARLEAIITALQHMNKAGLHTNEVLDYIRQKVDSQPAPLQPTTQSSDWLKEVIEAAEDFKYDNCRTTGDVVRFKLVLARAALNQPRVMSIGENAAWAKYNDLIHYIQTAEDSHDAETISESESESEDEDEETVRAAIGAVLKAISKPRARKNQAPQDRAHKKGRHSQ
eukprot:COSAG02_NODE_115_length_35467_cov_292.837056_23_plen_688_part_00